MGESKSGGVNINPYKEDNKIEFNPIAAVIDAAKNQWNLPEHKKENWILKRHPKKSYSRVIGKIHKLGLVGKLSEKTCREIPAGEFCLALKTVHDHLSSEERISFDEYKNYYSILAYINMYPRKEKIPIFWEKWKQLRKTAADIKSKG